MPPNLERIFTRKWNRQWTVVCGPLTKCQLTTVDRRQLVVLGWSYTSKFGTRLHEEVESTVDSGLWTVDQKITP